MDFCSPGFLAVIFASGTMTDSEAYDMPDKGKRQLAVLALIGTAVLWSIGGLLIKTVQWNPFGIAGGRSLIALIVFLPFLRKCRFQFTFEMIAAAVAYSLTTLLFTGANKLTTAANAILLQYTAPVFVILLASVLLKERMTKVDILCVAGVTAGLVLFVMEGIGRGHLLGDLMALCSGFTFACLAVFMRKQKDANPMESVILGNLINAVICLPVGLVLSRPQGGLEWLVVLGLVQLGFSYLLYSFAIRYVSALQTVLLTVFEPLLNPVWVFLATGERPGWLALAGGAVVLGMVVLHAVLKNRERTAMAAISSVSPT
jgi:drug/metabolite transporter (DMT)-like permease